MPAHLSTRMAGAALLCAALACHAAGAIIADDGWGRPPAAAVPLAPAADEPVAPPAAPPAPPSDAPVAPSDAPVAPSDAPVAPAPVVPAPEATAPAAPPAPPAQPAVPDCGPTALPPAPPAASAQAVVGTADVARPCLPPYACPSDCPATCFACPERCNMYVSLSADMFSGLGGTGTFGWVMQRTECLETAFEVSYTHMDQWEEFDGEGQRGKLDVLRVGLAWRTDPCCDRHWTWRAGLAYFRADGRPSEIDFDFVDIPIPGDYLGGYLGVGYEWDFGRCNRWSHGPELQLLGGWEVSESEFAFTPTIRWGLSYRF